MKNQFGSANVEIDKWIVEADISSMQSAMESGAVSSEDLVSIYLSRIQMYDTKINSILEVNPDAVELARELDKERKERGSRGPLHGIPILLKDNIDTKDNMHTSAGSVALADSFAAKDSYVAAQLRSAGAVLLGKTNMTEWANFMSSTMWSGYSSRGGLTLNPYGPGELFVGGSSSGSAAAVAANLAAAAIGTETSGSIISPSSQNCVVGLKPTVGLIRTSGIIPITNSQDSAGPIARTVKDAAILLTALTRVDEDDPAKVSAQNHCNIDYTQFLDADFLRHARIGIPRFYFQELDDARLEIVEAAIELLKSKGAIMVDPIEIPCQQTVWDFNVLRYEFKKYLNEYLASLADSVPVHSLKELILFNENHADVALKYGQNHLIWAEETSGTLTEQEYVESKMKNIEMAGRQGIDHAIKEHGLDVLLFLGNEGGSDLAARAGYPIITVPAGYAETGMITPGGYTTNGPQGVTFVGSAWSEPLLLKIAYGFEQATKFRFPPRLD